MLNLVQLQERLKDLPVQALMQYANGTNPQVPPFLALTELNRRKKMQEGAAAEQAKEMEGAPTVKDQIEQAAGLLSLQGSRQRQAAQQQAGIQAAMPMAAPNTTTSEPAQMAAGGAVDDIVVPRDFQMGGAVNPDVVKMLMARAMQKRRPPGVAGLPMRQGMFNRGDYAGGGIVAFDAGGSVKRVSGKTLEEYLASVTATLNSMSNLTENEKQQRIEMARQQFLTSPPDTPNQSDYPDESIRGIKPGIAGIKQAPPAANREGASERPQAAPTGIGGLLRRALSLDPETYFKTGESRTIEQIMDEQKRLQGKSGISEAFLDERERRLGELQAKREASRAGQPMDQLAEFLGGIAEARGGTFGTQGAKGARASRALRAQQEALRDKQDMDMEELKFASAAKRDAIRRGDMGEAQKQKLKEEEIRRDMLKNQADLATKQAQLESEDAYRRGMIGTRQEEIGLLRDRNLLDKTRADQTRQMSEISEYISNFRAKNANNPKYINKSDLLEQDAIAAAMRFFGPERFKNLGLAPGMGASAAAPSGPRPPLTSFQR